MLQTADIPAAFQACVVFSLTLSLFFLLPRAAFPAEFGLCSSLTYSLSAQIHDQEGTEVCKPGQAVVFLFYLSESRCSSVPQQLLILLV